MIALFNPRSIYGGRKPGAASEVYTGPVQRRERPFSLPQGLRRTGREELRFELLSAVPRDVDPEINKLDGIFVYDIDDLQSAVASHVADRRKEAERAEAIVDAEVERFQARLKTADVVPTIVSLHDHLETIRQAEIDRVRGRLGSLTPEQEMALETLTRGIVNKVLHTPISALKTAARDPQATTLIELVRKLFNLQEESQARATAASKSETGKRSGTDS